MTLREWLREFWQLKRVDAWVWWAYPIYGIVILILTTTGAVIGLLVGEAVNLYYRKEYDMKASYDNRAEWLKAARFEVRYGPKYVTSDSLVASIGMPPVPNMLGAFMTTMVKSGSLVPAGRVQSSRPSARGRKINVYTSNGINI